MNILVADLTSISDKLLLENLNNTSIFENFLQRALKVEKMDKLVLNALKEQNNFIEIARSKKFLPNVAKEKPSDIIGLLKEVSRIARKEQAKNVCLLYADSPFLDHSATNQLLKIHIDNFAEYTFGDDYPDGIVAEFLNNEFLERITEFQPKKPDMDSRRIFNCTNADINQFYIEVELPEYDLSKKRLNLTASSKRNLELIKRISKHCDGEFQYTKLPGIIEKNPEILRVFPKYVEIELTNECNLKCYYCPMRKMTRKPGYMELALYKKIIDELASEYNDVIVSFSLYGEPTLHKNLVEMLNYNIQKGIFSTILETNGVLFNKKLADSLTDIPAQKFQVIFGLDAVTEPVYKKVRESSGLNEVINNIKYYIQKDEKNMARSFIQIVKMKDTLHEIDKFFGFWEPQTKNLILQKYNSFAGQMPDLKVADLTPLERIPCWHLQRDLVVFYNGDVVLCKQDFDGKKIIGNLQKEPLRTIWDKLLPVYKPDYSGDCGEFELCPACDEWYTYNF